jgi:aquaporin Z
MPQVEDGLGLGLLLSHGGDFTARIRTRPAISPMVVATALRKGFAHRGDNVIADGSMAVQSTEDAMNKYLAELVGTFVLVFCGVGAAVLDGKDLGPLGISLAFGLTLLAMAYAIGPISGCHINPAVTIGMAAAGRTKWADVPGYVIAQVIGGIAGAGALLPIAPNGIAGAANTLQGSYTTGPGFLVEALLTMVLVLTVIGATSKNAPGGFAGVPIGLALAVTNFVGIPVTNASINPARSIGPALYSHGGDAVAQLWLFIVAPVVGGILAALIYMIIREKE